MAITWNDAADGQLASTKGTLYTVVGTEVGLFITLCNTHSAALTVTIYIKRTGTSRKIFSSSIPAGGSTTLRRSGLVLKAADLVEGDDGGTGSKVDYTVSTATP